MKTIKYLMALLIVLMSGCSGNWTSEEIESNMDGPRYELSTIAHDKDGNETANGMTIYCYKGDKPFGYILTAMTLPTTGPDRTHRVRLKFDSNEPFYARLLGAGVVARSYSDPGFVISQDLLERMMGAEKMGIEFSSLIGDGYFQLNLKGLKSEMEKLYAKGCQRGWKVNI